MRGKEKEKSKLRHLIVRLLYRDEGRRDEAFERHANLRLADSLIRTLITLRHFSVNSLCTEVLVEKKKNLMRSILSLLHFVTFCLPNGRESICKKFDQLQHGIIAA